MGETLFDLLKQRTQRQNPCKPERKPSIIPELFYSTEECWNGQTKLTKSFFRAGALPAHPYRKDGRILPGGYPQGQPVGSPRTRASLLVRVSVAGVLPSQHNSAGGSQAEATPPPDLHIDPPPGRLFRHRRPAASAPLLLLLLCPRVT